MSLSIREELFANGVHFGHQTHSWCPKMKRYIWGEKDGVHLINVAITEAKILEAQALLKTIAATGQNILWVGTKRVARNAIMRCAQDTSSPFFAERWIGGTLTNYHEVKKAVTNMLYNKEILEKADRQMYTKKEMNYLQKKIDKAERSVGGIERLNQKPGVLIIVGVKEERVALKEAQRMGIPVIALVDTNCDPTGIRVVIPANDDRENGVSLILGYLHQAVKEGKEEYLKANPLSENDEQDAKNSRNKNVKKYSKQSNTKQVDQKTDSVKADHKEVVAIEQISLETDKKSDSSEKTEKKDRFEGKKQGEGRPASQGRYTKDKFASKPSANSDKNVPSERKTSPRPASSQKPSAPKAPKAKSE